MPDESDVAGAGTGAGRARLSSYYDYFPLPSVRLYLVIVLPGRILQSSTPRVPSHPQSSDHIRCPSTTVWHAYFQIHISTDACTNIGFASSSSVDTQNLTVLICTNKPSLASSVIFLDTSQPRHSYATTTRVYRARLVGPEAHVLPVAYCSTYMAVATYPLAAAGNYSLELMQLYTSFSFGNVTPMQRNIFLAKVAVNLVPVIPPWLLASRHMAPCSDSNCSLHAERRTYQAVGSLPPKLRPSCPTHAPSGWRTSAP
jgi:hypothetical protein